MLFCYAGKKYVRQEKFTGSSPIPETNILLMQIFFTDINFCFKRAILRDTPVSSVSKTNWIKIYQVSISWSSRAGLLQSYQSMCIEGDVY